MVSVHTCPVCAGRGFVDWTFYQNDPNNYGIPSTTAPFSTVPCRTCGGQGVLWEQSVYPVATPTVTIAGGPTMDDYMKQLQEWLEEVKRLIDNKEKSNGND